MKQTDLYLYGGLAVLTGLFLSSCFEDDTNLPVDGDDFSYLNDATKTRCLRNNNAGCMDKGQQWRGLINGNDSRFCTFSSIGYGIRAVMKLISGSAYIGGGINTFQKIFQKYAPGHENNTQAYIDNVANFTGIAANTVITANEQTLKALVKAICKVENGGYILSDAELNKGYSLLLQYPN